MMVLLKEMSEGGRRRLRSNESFGGHLTGNSPLRFARLHASENFLSRAEIAAAGRRGGEIASAMACVYPWCRALKEVGLFRIGLRMRAMRGR